MEIFDRVDYFLDSNEAGHPKMVFGDALRAGLDQIARQPFRLVPYFDPGVWGGQWMKEVCDLPPDAPNYAWSFDGVPEENSICFDFDGTIPEMPAMNEAIEAEIEKGAACLYLTNDYYSPLTQDLAQLALFEQFYATDSMENDGVKAYLASQGDPSRLVVFVDTDEFWSSGFNAEELLSAYVAQSAYQSARQLYAFGLSETWVLEK